MPYVAQDIKDALNEVPIAENAGELTYLLTMVLVEYLTNNGVRYEQLAECLGALEGAKLDLIKRVVNPYEDKKQKENGDVWPQSVLNACS